MIIAITSIRLRSLWNLFKFGSLVGQILKQIKSQKGFVTMKASPSIGYTHYTVSAWRSEADLKTFARSGAHLSAMKQTARISTEVKSYIYQAETTPDIKSAKKILAEKGKVITY
jgi:hypothetical protein